MHFFLEWLTSKKALSLIISLLLYAPGRSAKFEHA